jgi:hypothetical protein
MAGATIGAEIADFSGTPEFTLGFFLLLYCCTVKHK